MENKYYTPSIEELHIGFEYEQFSHLNGKWESKFLDYSPFMTILDEENCDCSEHHIRVKYLDKEDIESLGFNKLGMPTWYEFKELTSIFNSGVYRLRLCNQPDKEDNVRITISDSSIDDEIIYAGKIKNKSELKVLLKQLGI